MGELDQLEQLVLGHPVVGDDQLVEPVVEERRGRGRRGDVPDELVVDASSTRAERAAEMRDLAFVPDEQHAPPDADGPQHRSRDRLVAPAEKRDAGGDQNRRDDVEAEGLELLAVPIANASASAVTSATDCTTRPTPPRSSRGR